MTDQALQPSPASAPDAGDALDELLQRSRRVDWRFLLPDPRLGNVVYFGPGMIRCARR